MAVHAQRVLRIRQSAVLQRRAERFLRSPAQQVQTSLDCYSLFSLPFSVTVQSALDTSDLALYGT